jgi:putative tryptophan/tyrosine transport system substrate-binding protein
MKWAIVVAVAVLSSGIIAEAQQSGKLYRVGVLQPATPEERNYLRGFRAGLPKFGYFEGKNIQLNIPNGKSFDELRPIAKTYVEQRVDLILSIGGSSTSIAKDATKEIPILFVSVSADPVELGFVKSLARPETNLTGLASVTDAEIEGKRLELFKELVPSLRRVALLYNARGETPAHETRLKVVREVAPKLGLKINEKPSKSMADVDEVLRAVSREITDGIFMISSGFFRVVCKQILTTAIQKKVPLWGCGAETGSLASYLNDGYHHGIRAAWYADKIFKGSKPTDLPVERPINFEFVVNLRTAKEIGLTIPPNVLVDATKVIK